MRHKSIFSFVATVFASVYVMSAGQLARAVTIDVQPPNPTTEDVVIINILDTLSGCTDIDSIRTSAQDTLFDFDIWTTEPGGPYICHMILYFHLADTVGPLATGTYSIRTAWDWTFDDKLFDSLYGGTTIIEKQFTVTGPLDIDEIGDAGPPAIFVLNQNYPNPFNLGTTVSFSLREPADVELSVYDILGRQVRQLATQPYPAGVHEVFFDGKNDAGAPLPSGMYFCRATAGANTATRRMVLLK